MARPDTADTQAYRNQINQGIDFHTPINFAYGQAENNINDQFFENDLPESVRERIKHGQKFGLMQQKGNALSDAYAREQAFKTGNMGSLAGMTQSVLTNPNTTTTQSGGFMDYVNPIMQGASLGVAA